MPCLLDFVRTARGRLAHSMEMGLPRELKVAELYWTT
jgi:hypothetical protein